MDTRAHKLVHPIELRVIDRSVPFSASRGWIDWFRNRNRWTVVLQIAQTTNRTRFIAFVSRRSSSSAWQYRVLATPLSLFFLPAESHASGDFCQVPSIPAMLSGTVFILKRGTSQTHAHASIMQRGQALSISWRSACVQACGVLSPLVCTSGRSTRSNLCCSSACLCSQCPGSAGRAGHEVE